MIIKSTLTDSSQNDLILNASVTTAELVPTFKPNPYDYVTGLQSKLDGLVDFTNSNYSLIVTEENKNTDNPIIKIVDNTKDNQSISILHPESGSFIILNRDGKLYIKTKDVIEFDDIVTTSKLKTYLSTVLDSVGNPIFNLSSPPIQLADIGTENIKVKG